MTTAEAEIDTQRPGKSASGRPVRVIHVVQNLNTGGLEKLLIEMLTLTDPEVVSPSVLCIGEPGELANEVLSLGTTIHALRQPPGRNLRLPWLLARHFRDLDADLIHTHGPYAHLYGALAARLLANFPVIHTKHGYLWPWTRHRHLQNRLAALFSSRIVAVSQNLADYLRSAERITGSKLRLVHNGINIAKFDRPIDPSQADRPVAVMVSRLSTEKDFETLFRAVAIVGQQLPNFEMRLIGDGPIRTQLEQLSQEIGVQDTVRFLGNRPDVPKQLAEAWLFVLSSNTEGMSIALLEAMASRLPAIATAVGGNPEVIVDGETGFLVSPQSPEEMAEKMLWLLTHRKEAVSMGAAGRRRVEAHFNIRQTVKGYEELYCETAGQYQRHRIRNRAESLK